VTEFEGGMTEVEDRVVVNDSHPAIVSRELFARVQSQFADRKRSSTPIQGGGHFVLTGLLRCGDCGYTMIGNKTPLDSGAVNIFYRCNGFATKGVGFCHPHNVFQDDILKAVFNTLADRLDNPENAARIRKEFERQLKNKAVSVDSDAVERQLKQAKVKLDKAVKRLVEVDSDLVSIVQEQVREMRLAVTKLESELQAASVSVKDSMVDYDARIEAAAKMFHQLRVIYKKADPALLRSFLQSCINTIEVSVSRKPSGGRYRYKFEGGKIIGKEGSSLFSSW
jgi:hypothetical protein